MKPGPRLSRELEVLLFDLGDLEPDNVPLNLTLASHKMEMKMKKMK